VRDPQRSGQYLSLLQRKGGPQNLKAKVLHSLRTEPYPDFREQYRVGPAAPIVQYSMPECVRVPRCLIVKRLSSYFGSKFWVTVKPGFIRKGLELISNAFLLGIGYFLI